MLLAAFLVQPERAFTIGRIQRSRSTGSRNIGPDIRPRIAMTDKGYDSQVNRAAALARGIASIIPRRDYFRARKPFSSGMVEGLNNKAKLTMRKSYGFRTFHVTEIALYHTLGKLPDTDVAYNSSDEAKKRVLHHGPPPVSGDRLGLRATPSRC